MICHRLPCGLKSALRVAALLLALSSARAEETPPGESLRQGLYAEEVTRDPEAAAKHYAAIIAAEDRRRATVATAIFRLAEVRRAQGKKDEAIALYQKLLREYPAAEAEGKLAREHLAKLGGKVPEGAAPAVDEETMEIERLRKLLASSPDLLNDASPLVTAVDKNHPRVVKFLLDAGMKDAEWDAIKAVVENGNLELTKVLLPAYNLKDAERADSLLAEAIGDGFLEVTRALLAGGADPNWQSESRRTDGSRPVWGEAPDTSLCYAIKQGQFGIARLLLDNGADPKAVERDTGAAVLHFAAYSSHEEAPALVARLIELGADPNALTKELRLHNNHTASTHRLSPLQCAALGRSPACAKILAKSGADLKQPGIFEPLFSMWTTTTGDAVNLLLEVGADPDSRDASGDPPLAKVISNGTMDLAESLLKHGANANIEVTIPDNNGNRSKERVAGGLLFHTRNQNDDRRLKMAKLLLDAGAKPEEDPAALWWILASLDDDGSMVRRLIALTPGWSEKENLASAMKPLRPAARRVFLDEFAIPGLLKSPGIHLIKQDPPELLSLALTESSSSASPAIALHPHVEFLTSFSRNGSSATCRPVMNLVAQDKDGLARNPLTLAGDESLPPWKDGTVIEIQPDGKWVGGSGEFEQVRSEVAFHLRRRIEFPITVEIGGVTRALKVRGGLLVHDPTRDEVPLLKAGDLTMLFLPQVLDKDGVYPRGAGTVTVTRGKETTELDLQGKAAWEFELRENDALAIKHLASWSPEGRIRIAVRDRFFTRDMPVNDQSGPVSLIELLADVCSPTVPQAVSGDGGPAAADFLKLASSPRVPTILPRPDFSSVRILRKGDDGKEQVIKANLAEAIARCTDETPAADARAVDVPLQPGDTVEFLLKPASADKPWQGLQPDEQRFFDKVLAGTVTWKDNEGVIRKIPLGYHQPDWRATAHGLLPFRPKSGMPTTRFDRLDFNGGFSCQVTRGKEMLYESRLFLRDGDEMMPYQGPMPGTPPVVPSGIGSPRQRVVPPGGFPGHR